MRNVPEVQHYEKTHEWSEVVNTSHQFGKEVTVDNFIHHKYIYLDWNVYFYMENPRQDDKGKIDEAMKELVMSLKDEYFFPYSDGHIQDLSSKFDESKRGYIKTDIAFAETINDQWCAGGGSNEEVIEIAFQKKPMMDFFNEHIGQSDPTVEDLLNDMGDINFSEFDVDMSKMQKDHPLYEIVKANGGKMSGEILKKMLVDSYTDMFSNSGQYKQMRSYVDKVDLNNLNRPMQFVDRMEADRELYYQKFFYDCLDDDEKTLQGKWASVVKRYLSRNGGNAPLEKQLIQGYSLLDMHPLFHDKLKKNNTLDNIRRDGIHCFYASKADYFVSEDEKTRRKISFMYDAYGIKTEVVSEEEFIKAMRDE